MSSTIYLIPSVLSEGKTEVIPAYVLKAVKKCSVFYVENERTTRRFLKLLWKEMVIDDYKWVPIKEVSSDTINSFKSDIKEGKTIGIISEAGCPGVADPGQQLAEIAQQMNIELRPLVGPSSILLALMASGMNGQQFQFVGYLPIEGSEKITMIRSLESESRQKFCTQIFIETPYRNNQLIETILKTCSPTTRLCIAVDITGDTESIKTKTIQQWKAAVPNLHKRPAIFLLYAH